MVITKRNSHEIQSPGANTQEFKAAAMLCGISLYSQSSPEKYLSAVGSNYYRVS